MDWRNERLKDRKEKNKQAEVKVEEPKTEKIKENKKQEIEELTEVNKLNENENKESNETINLNQENEKESYKNSTKKNRRKKRVLAVLILAMIIIYVIERGEYLEIKEIGENYVSMFWQNMKYRAIAVVVNFVAIFSLVYTTTTRIKRGLKVFFEDEKKTMPKLPHKSIAFII